MPDVTRKIGLSLGADICWPIAYTEILKRLDLAVPWGGDTVRIDVDRMNIGPFDLEEHTEYDLVIDRLTHWYHVRREWIKKAVLLDDVYVFNNPWSVQSMEKLTTYAAMIRLGFPIPRTWLLPPKSYESTEADLDFTLQQYARYFDIPKIGEALGYPLFMKPYDGGGWRAVSRVDDAPELMKAYERSGTAVMHLQQAVTPFDRFVRCVGLGPQTRVVLYDIEAPLHDRYTMEREFASEEELSLIRDMTLVINAFFAWDFNSCELIHKNGTWYPIDFANPCPDSQVTSLHYHFPWLILANLRWSIFAAVTKRRMRPMGWRRYFRVVEEGMTLRERLDRLVPIAHRRFQTEAFEEFCSRHLGHLPEVALEFFRSEAAKDAVRQKVVRLFPEHEVEEFTELFFGRIQSWIERGRSHGVKLVDSWQSERLGREVTVARWGTFGTPFLIFPTAGGDAEEIERFHVIGTLAPYVEAGRIKIYSCDSVAGGAMLAEEGSPSYRMALLDRFLDYVGLELVPAIRTDCESEDIGIVVGGASIGAFNALASICRFPEHFTHALCMSGTYDLERFLKAPTTREFWNSSPVHYLPDLEGPRLEALRERFILLASGEGKAEDIGESWRVAHLLGSRGIPNRVDSWGMEWAHDWPTWRNMLFRYVEELVPGDDG